MNIKRLICLYVLLFSFSALAQAKPALTATDRIRLAEAFSLSEHLGDKIWRGWHQTAFAVLLVTPETEFLIRHPQPSKDFTPLGYDTLLKSEVYYRPRVFQTNLLATFPAVGGIPTVVVGQAENTDQKHSTAWIITLLHEHFHQLQTSQAGYYQSVNQLNLSKGDQTGMWMLNYNFPYTNEKVAGITQKMARKLSEILAVKQMPAKNFRQQVSEYLSLRGELKNALSTDDYAYFSFQLWQEGIARYTQYHVAEMAARNYQPSQEFRRLKDFRAFKAVEKNLREEILRELDSMSLSKQKRVAFYPLGAAEGLLLDRFTRGWRKFYFDEKFYLEKYFQTK